MVFSRRRFLVSSSAIAFGTSFAFSAVAKTLNGSLNARDFGVKPDGGDQSRALQKAINQAAKEQVPLFLPGGDYALSNISLPSGIQFIGVPGQTVLNYSGGGELLAASDAENISLQGLSLRGNKLDFSPSSKALLVARNTRNLRLESCRIFDSFANCVSLHNVSGKISGCELSQAREAGLFSVDAQGLTISDCLVDKCDNNGILVWRSQKGEDGTIVTGNRIINIKAVNGGSGQNGNGINIFRAHNVIAAQNHIRDCAFSAVRSNAGSACQILGNSCSRIGEVALYAEFGFEGAVIAQNIVADAASGVSITNFNEGGRLGVCASNIIRDLFVREGEIDARGVGIGVEADTLVTGNLVENAPVMGISLGWGKYLRDVSVTGNIIRKSRIGIGVSVSSGAGQALISDNLISGATAQAIGGYDYQKKLTEDLIDSVNAARFSNLTIRNNVAS